MGKSVGRKIGLAGIVIFVILMLLLSGLCWWLWHNRSSGVPTAAPVRLPGF
mgnify:CR=1 FL=1